MNIRLAVLWATIATLILAVGGVAVAATTQCGFSSSENPCRGTSRADTLNGTPYQDYIEGAGAGDVLYGYEAQNGSNWLYGDDYSDSSRDGNDKLYGGPGLDVLQWSFGGDDLLVGRGGRDSIYALEEELPNRPTPNPGVDTVKGNSGSDFVYAVDGYKDYVNCGRGKDTVHFDQGLDVITNCEVLDPQ